MKKAKSTEEHVKKVYTNKLQVTTSSDLDKRVIANSMNAFAKVEKTSSADIPPNPWRIIMKSKITKFAVAAMLIIAVLIGINQFGGPIDGTSIAFGQMKFKAIAKLQQTSINTVQSRYRYGIDKLRSLLNCETEK